MNKFLFSKSKFTVSKI